MTTAEKETRRQREFEAKYGVYRVSLREGQVWEFVNTVQDTVSRYKLRKFDRGGALRKCLPHQSGDGRDRRHHRGLADRRRATGATVPLEAC